MLTPLLFQLVRLSAVPAIFLRVGLHKTAGSEATLARWAANFVILAGAVDAALTAMTGGEPIRVDLVLLLPIVALADLIAGFISLRRGSGTLLRVTAGILILLGTAGLVGQARSYLDTAKVSELLDRKRKLQFDARFRGEPSFRKVFGETSSSSDPLPGHYQPRSPGGWISRLIINTNGQVWLYFGCDGTECLFARGQRANSGAPPEIIELHPEVSAEVWSMTLEPASVGLKMNLQSARGPDPRVKDLVVARSQPRFTGTPAPVGDVLPLGVFSQVKPMNQHQRLLQLWLWRNDSAFWGYYVRTIQARSTHARFILPRRIEGALVRSDGGLRFDARDGREELHGQLANGSVALRVVYAGSPLEDAVLAPGAVIEDEVFDLAPDWSRKDQDEWFRAVLTGTFVEWRVP